MTALRLMVNAGNPAPYAPDVRAKGWRFDLDPERIKQSDTWALCDREMRPWLLMLWMTAWEQVPCGSLPADDALVAARIDMPLRTFQAHRDMLMRGWWLADDGRLYHATITERVLDMLGWKDKEASRKAAYRASKNQRLAAECPTGQTQDGHVSPTAATTPSPSPSPTTLNTREATPLVGTPQASRLPACPTEAIVGLYHEHLPMLPRVEVLSESRKRAISARWREVCADPEVRKADDVRAQALAWWAWFFGYCATSRFLTGRAKSWKADLDFLMTPSKFARCVEGLYHKDSMP